MSIRSRYSSTSYIKHRVMNRQRMKQQMCTNCKYRLESENLENDCPNIPEIPIIPEEKLTPTQSARKQRLQQKHAQRQQSPAYQKLEQPPFREKNIFKRFGENAVRNQEDMKEGGETTLMDDLSNMGKKMFNNIVDHGEEELNNLQRRTGVTRKENNNDFHGGI